MDDLIPWFMQQGGTIDSAYMGLTDFPGQGRGAIALQDIPKDHVLFTLPRSLTLSLRTSNLPILVGPEAWKKLELYKGWVGLILCMMWEEAQGKKSKWFGYLKSLPTEFDTPMFWSANELRELEGTSIQDKIGKADAERDYAEKLVPALQSRPDLFEPDHLSTHYSLENYHIMGSRILSRSFHVEQADSEETTDDKTAGDVSIESQGSAMSVDTESAEPAEAGENEEAGDDSESDDEDEEDSADVAMVPMADMLNAQYASENAKLFYEPVELKLTTTKPIKAGEQIYNTYANPPNSELLRRYGHVDLIPLPPNEKGETLFGNPADVVDINADVVAEVLAASMGHHKGPTESYLKERIDWWLEEGGDDVFTLESDANLPDAMVSFAKLLQLPDAEWKKQREKGKPPKPKIDAQLNSPLIAVIGRRLIVEYSTTDTQDERYLSAHSEPPLSRKAKAVVVRVGEKRILANALKKLQEQEKAFAEAEAESSAQQDNKKRKREGAGKVGKRSKR